jgi:hypothetical protein
LRLSQFGAGGFAVHALCISDFALLTSFPSIAALAEYEEHSTELTQEAPFQLVPALQVVIDTQLLPFHDSPAAHWLEVAALAGIPLAVHTPF